MLLYVFVLFGLWCKSNNYVDKIWSKKKYVKQEKYITDFNFSTSPDFKVSTSPDFKFSTSPDFNFSTSPDFKFSTSPAYKTTHQGERMSEVFVPGML